MRISDISEKLLRLNKKFDILNEAIIQSSNGGNSLNPLSKKMLDEENYIDLVKAYKNWKGDLLIEFFRKIKNKKEDEKNEF